MRPAARALLLAAALAGVALAMPRAQPEREPPRPPLPLPSGRVDVLVDVADQLSAEERAQFIAVLPGAPRLNSAFSEGEGLYTLTLDAADARGLLVALAQDLRVEHAELDSEYEALDLASRTPGAGAPDDPLYPFQWNLAQIDVEGAWGATRGRGAVVAVIDTGVAYADGAGGAPKRVRDLAGTAFVAGYDFVDDDEAPFDTHGHGTHVAGTVAQTTNNGYGVAGVAPAATIMPIRVLDARGRGSTGDIAEAVRFAADNGAHVINLSLGGPLPSAVLRDAVAYARRKGVTVVAAAGNGGSARPSYPAAYPGVISVAATQFDRTTTFYSNFGSTLDVAAPGGNTRVDQNGDGRPDGVLQETLRRENLLEHEFALYMGTSMASPHVAGVAALLHAAGARTPDRVEAFLESTASRAAPLYRPDRYGHGIVDATAAMRAVMARTGLPRVPVALLVVAVATGVAGRRRRDDVSLAVASGAAVVVAAGPALIGLVAATIGVPIVASAQLATAVPLGTTAVAFSAVTPIALYAAFGHATGRARAVVVGAMAGWAACLLAESAAPMFDVLGVPGTGWADRSWSAANGLAATFAAAVALRAR